MGKRTGTGQGGLYPRKRVYRARAHGNPLNDASFPVPLHPDEIDWSEYYAERFEKVPEGEPKPVVEFVDIGCGFGGLLVRLSTMFPDKLMMGMELRDKVTEFVKKRIVALRQENPGDYDNIACVRTNSMKFLPNYFKKGQLEKMFFLFPDPHFKVGNHRRRIINDCLLTEYAHFLKPGGIVYTITDVPELGEWMKNKLEEHPMFERLTEGELKSDPIVEVLQDCTEEGQKVARLGGEVFPNIYRRLEQPKYSS